jgi:hypothetical protein
MKFAVLALAFTLAAFTATFTWAAQAQKERVTGPSAFAFFEDITADECVLTLVNIEAFSRILHAPPGPPNSRSEVFVIIDQFNLCTGEQLVFAIGNATLSDSDFEVSKKLESARLITTIEVSDSVSGSSFDVSIDVTWTATGQPVKQKLFVQTRSADFFQIFKSSGTFADASASGTVSDGTTNFIQTADFVFAAIVDVTTGQVFKSR